MIKTSHVLEKETCTEQSLACSKRGLDYMVFDSGASEHIVADIGLFYTITGMNEVNVELADRSTVMFEYSVKVFIDIGSMPVSLGTLLIIPKHQVNLLSCSRIDEPGITTMISERKCSHWTGTDTNKV